jgi:hypothetical protein
MHSQATINQFIELRAEDKPLREIAELLKISTTLAWKWSHQHAQEIEQLAFARKEALRHKYTHSYETKLADIARELTAIDEELKQRDFGDVSTEFLLYRKTCQQSRFEKLAALTAPKPVTSEDANKSEQNANKSEQN